MKHSFSTLPVLALTTMGLLAPNVEADKLNNKTNLSINQPIEVDGTVLPAGSYVLKVADLDRHIVQIFNAQENHVIATAIAVPAERLVTPDGSEFKFYESRSGQPPALRTWFYPGNPIGLEFKDLHRAQAVTATQSGNPVTPSVSTN